MTNPVSAILAKCKIGFTPMQKLGLSCLLLFYVVSPIDFFPIWFLPIDDVGALILLGKVLFARTLLSSDAGTSLAAAPAIVVRPAESARSTVIEQVGPSRNGAEIAS